MTIKGGTMKRDELYANYIGVMNINAVLKQQNSELLEVLKQVKMDIEFESLGLGDLKKQIKQAIAKAEGE